MNSPSLDDDRPLVLRDVLAQLASQHILDAADTAAVLHTVNAGRHPLVAIAQRQLADRRPPHATLCLETLTQWLAEHSGLPYWRIDPFEVDALSITAQVPAAFAEHHQILPLRVEAERIIVATAQPGVRSWHAALASATQKRIEPVVANPEVIARLIGQYFSLAHSVRGARQASEAAEPLPQPPSVANAPVAQIVDWLLGYAFEQGSSDIHLEPRGGHAQIRLRIDGQLRNVYSLPSAVATAVISRLKSLAQLNLAEKRKPQDGRFRHNLAAGQVLELRAATLPTPFGEKIALRVFDPQVLQKRFADLGLAGEPLARWQGIIAQPNGIILVTGPTGSGKTTTLYTTLGELARPEVNLCTLEDPIEIVNPAFNQMQVRHNIELGFASGLRALMRQDPDIIMVGEIRDGETAQMAVQAALTGHLVLSTLHTNDAPSAITRLLELGVPGYLINATLRGVMAQRLLRSLCPRCKAASPLPEGQWAALIHPWQAAAPRQVYNPVGCHECHGSGYRGRLAVYEILPLPGGDAEQPSAGLAPGKLRAQAYRQGMRPLRISGLLQVAAGATSVQEVLRVTPAVQGNSCAAL
ncbi:ATPase, T2SS/T4P/T4SS family [Pseudomonas sp. NPDC007930]|uniref:GspE/PulE family protein n=1 Tax=Pseudomonas sp. NPDC007930 TaxID=3364417 RepID=UPI0036E31103